MYTNLPSTEHDYGYFETFLPKSASLMGNLTGGVWSYQNLDPFLLNKGVQKC